MMKVYQHTQVGYFLIVTYSLVILFLGVLNILSDFHPIPLIGLVIMVIVLGFFLRKGFPLKDVEAYQVVENPWYYGWGIRYTPRGWLFRVSGRSAIELQMKSGKVYRIGTDEPNRLAKALNKALQFALVD
jgi:hypothetical protein